MAKSKYRTNAKPPSKLFPHIAILHNNHIVKESIKSVIILETKLSAAVICTGLKVRKSIVIIIRILNQVSLQTIGSLIFVLRAGD